MSELSIKVNIAGRIYPLTIKRNEEQSVRLAAKKIEDSIKKFQDNYAVKDKQDLLAMTALQLSTELANKEGVPVEDPQLAENLKSINQMLDGAIS